MICGYGISQHAPCFTVLVRATKYQSSAYCVPPETHEKKYRVYKCYMKHTLIDGHTDTQIHTDRLTEKQTHRYTDTQIFASTRLTTASAICATSVQGQSCPPSIHHHPKQFAVSLRSRIASLVEESHSSQLWYLGPPHLKSHTQTLPLHSSTRSQRTIFPVEAIWHTTVRVPAQSGGLPARHDQIIEGPRPVLVPCNFLTWG